MHKIAKARATYYTCVVGTESILLCTFSRARKDTLDLTPSSVLAIHVGKEGKEEPLEFFQDSCHLSRKTQRESFLLTSALLLFFG